MPERPNEPGPNDAAPAPSGGSGSDDALIAAARAAAEARSDGLPPDPDLPPADFFPGYIVVREIHRGGQGVVYQAIHKGTKRKVAIKVLLEGALAGPRERTRFEREVEILAQLDHPNIVAVHDSGLAEGRFYYVMDYVSGQTLDVYLSQHDLSMPEVLAMFVKICEAVNAAHLKGVIHRDLKPANVRVDAKGEPHVVDFGLAKVATGEMSDEAQPRLMTMTGQFIGSLPWASPEQAQGMPSMIDVRTDVYSLGVVLYQALTGRFPYQVIGAMRDVLDNILRAEPARPSTIRRQINDEVETIVLKCLSKQRERRYQNAGELARDLERYLRGEPIEAKRDSGWYVLSKMARRHRGPVAVAALLLVLLVGFSIAMTALYQRARAAELLAEDRLTQAKAQSETRRQVVDALEGWLAAADPTRGEDREITVAEVLDHAAATIGVDLAGQPQVEVALRNILGRTFYGLGHVEQAKAQFEGALALARRTLPEDDDDHLFALANLPVALYALDENERAAALFDEALARLLAVRGPAHEETLTTAHNLAKLHFEDGRAEDAERIWLETLAALDAAPSPPPDLDSIVRATYAVLLEATGRADEAEPMLRGAVEALASAGGPDHPDTARARVRLGALLRRLDRTDEAEREFAAAAASMAVSLGPSHPDTLATRAQLAALLEATGRPADAERELAAVLADGAETLPPLSRAWFGVLHARTLTALARYDEAETALLVGHATIEQTLGPDHPRTLDTVRALVTLYESQGLEAKAAPWRDRLP
ncbi:MAG TPA: serine/threonine-protein kinase [Phycisphaerales bacterium]|nr:serine/threonine-protein kinase [Phycisphaerales bacterium]